MLKSVSCILLHDNQIRLICICCLVNANWELYMILSWVNDMSTGSHYKKNKSETIDVMGDLNAELSGDLLYYLY